SLQGKVPAQQLWLDFSRKAVGYEPGAAEQWWDSHRDQAPRSDYRHIFNMARQRGMLRVASVDAFSPVPQDPALNRPNGDLVDVVPPEVPGVPGGRILIRLSEPEFSSIVKQLEGVLLPEAYTQ